jgi:hypothetical protein
VGIVLVIVLTFDIGQLLLSSLKQGQVQYSTVRGHSASQFSCSIQVSQVVQLFGPSFFRSVAQVKTVKFGYKSSRSSSSVVRSFGHSFFRSVVQLNALHVMRSSVVVYVSSLLVSFMFNLLLYRLCM